MEAECPAERVSASYVVNADRVEGYIAILFHGVGITGRQFPFQECKQLRVFTDEIDRGTLSIGNNHEFEHTRRTPSDTDKKIIWSGSSSTGWLSFDPDSIDPKTPSFSLHIPIDELLTRNGADTWALDLQLVSIYPESKIVPNGILPYTLEVLTDQDLIIQSVEPALARTRPNPSAESSYTFDLENREVIGNDPFLLSLDNETQLNTINDTRLQLTLRDPDYSVRRDVGILVLSTLFGIAVTVLFEALLVLSVRQSLRGQMTNAREEGAGVDTASVSEKSEPGTKNES